MFLAEFGKPFISPTCISIFQQVDALIFIEFRRVRIEACFICCNLHSQLLFSQISSIPCWQFIGWISQLMAMLDKNEAPAVQHIVEKIASTYPQAIVYPFMISSESFSFPETAIGHKNKEFVER